MGAIKVQLAIPDDLKSTIGQYKTVVGALDGSLKDLAAAKEGMKKAEQLAAEAQKRANAAVQSANAAQTKGADPIAEAEDLAKKLGVSPSAVTGYSEANSLYRDLDAKIKQVNNFTF